LVSSFDDTKAHVRAKNGLWGVAEQDEIKGTTKEDQRRTGVVASKFRH